MKTRILLIIILISIQNSLFSQCNLSIDSAQYNSYTYLNPDTLQICLGNSVSFHSDGSCSSFFMANDFNNQTMGQGWYSYTIPMFNNPCGDGVDSTTYLWIGPSASFPRELTTETYNVTTNSRICFDMKYGSQANGTPCEGPDELGEAVHLQCSSSTSGPWTDINYWDPVGGYDPILTTWQHYCEDIPINGNIYFRWYQDVTSGNEYDHWGIDNIQIFYPLAIQSLEISDNMGNTISTGQWSATVTPTQSTTYYVEVSDGTNSAIDSLFISVYNPTALSIIGLDTVYHITSTNDTIEGIPSIGEFSGTGIIQPNIFSPSLAGIGTHSITYHHYYLGTNPSTGILNLFFDDFSTDKGWTGYAAQWTRDSAIASYGCADGNDPSLDHTTTEDNFIIGNYIGSCYPNSLSSTYWLTSPVINCSNKTSCVLEFWSHSGCESNTYDHLYLEAFNGYTWSNIYYNTSSFSETNWTLRTYNINEADNNPNFKIRFGIGSTDVSATYKGWNIDDLSIKCNGTILVTDTLCDFATSQNVIVTDSLTIVSQSHSIINTVLIYPNPTMNEINIKIPEKIQFYTIYITDIIGKKVYESNIEKNHEITLSIKDYNPGNYFVTIISMDGKLWTGKFLVE